MSVSITTTDGGSKKQRVEERDEGKESAEEMMATDEVEIKDGGSDDDQEKPHKRTGRRHRPKPGGRADCGDRSVPDGFLYHVVGTFDCDVPDGDGAAGTTTTTTRVMVKPGAPACWTPMNAGFFIGRHVAKMLPDVTQYACTTKASVRRTVTIRPPAVSSYAWPAYQVEFDESLHTSPPIDNTPPTAPRLSQLYSAVVEFGNAHMVDISAYLKSESTDFDVRTKCEESDSHSLVDQCIGSDGVPIVGVVLDLERRGGVTSPLLLATHCLILNRDVANDPGPARLIDSIPPVMRHDGMPDVATLERWNDIVRRRCQVTNEPVLAWGASTFQFGDGPRAKQNSIWRIVQSQMPSGKAQTRSNHDAWVETAFRVASMPFVSFLLKRRGVSMPDRQLPLADMPVWGRAYEKPLVTLHPLAPRRLFDTSAVLASTMLQNDTTTPLAEQRQVEALPFVHADTRA